MPRRAPDGKGVTEHRITFGNYERKFVTEVKNDIEKGVKIATISAVAIPVAAVTGLGLLGYGIYRGCNSFQAIDAESFGDAIKKTLTFGSGKIYGPLINPLAPLWDLIFEVV